MILHWLSEKLFPGDGDGNTEPSPVRPEIGAAALLIEAAHRDGEYTEIERDLATNAIMKLFHLDNAAARALRIEAEEAQAEAAYMMRFATAARQLDSDQKERLVTQIWAVADSDRVETISETTLIHSITDILGIPAERAKALHPKKPEGKD